MDRLAHYWAAAPTLSLDCARSCRLYRANNRLHAHLSLLETLQLQTEHLRLLNPESCSLIVGKHCGGLNGTSHHLNIVCYYKN